MSNMNIEKCPYCQSTNIGIGYQLGGGQIFADIFAYHSSADCANVEHILCKDCGSIIHSRVVKTDMFHQYSIARQEELREYIERNGIILCNENNELPSLVKLGYNMENIISLIEQKQVFYCKAYKKRSTYLSVKAYQLLSRCKPQKPLIEQAKLIYKAMSKTDVADKDELRVAMGMDKKEFDKAFDFLLENLYITAIAGRRLNPNWYSYLYCTAERWKQGVEGLHFQGDSKAALWKVVKNNMSEDKFIKFIK